MKEAENLDLDPPLDPFDAGKAYFWSHVLAPIAGFLCFALALGIFKISEEKTVVLLFVYIFFVVSYAVMLIVLANAGKKRGIPTAEAFRLKRVDLEASQVLLLILVGAAVVSVEMLAIGGVDRLLKGNLSEWRAISPPPTSEFSALTVLSAMRAMAVVSVVIVPIVEEMVFRGFLLNAFSGWGQEWAVIFLGILFALGHGRPFPIVGAFVIAVVSGIFAVKYDSIVPGILIHAGGNLVSAGLGYLEAACTPTVSSVCFLVVTIGSITALFLCRSKVSWIWQEFKLFWSRFRQTPDGWDRFKSLGKHWAWFLIFVSIAVGLIL
jgi:membrane protease YdiL (CAAX protease family)